VANASTAYGGSGTLSVPYIANLENGRGNPTAIALTRLAAALGMRLVITLAPDTPGKDLSKPDWWRILDALPLIASHPAVP
jgi:transcriptional regulator with XRE-family HTH domain